MRVIQHFKRAFTMLELIFVIVIMGIIGVVGAEIFRSTYDAYITSNVNNRLQSETELTLQQIGNRLQYRFKDSIIARRTDNTFDGLSSVSTDQNYTVVEWVGYDIDGWLGDDTNTTPTWSGFIDVDNGTANATLLISQGSDFTASGRIDTAIVNLGSSSISNAAIFFTGANTDVQKDYGWNYANYDINNTAAHPIQAALAINQIVPNGYTFSGMDVYEQYKLAWTAYAIGLNADNELILYYDYQPWQGETYQNGTSVLLAEHVDTFKFQAIGDIVKVQICMNNNWYDNLPDNQIYSLCKEKVVF